jgi:hypothetical protein
MAMRTVWDVLTSVGRDVHVLYPYRPSHAIVELPNDWQLSVTVSPTTASTLGQRFAEGLEQQIETMDVQGRTGSPEGWFDRAPDAEVAILRPDGSWYHCESEPPDVSDTESATPTNRRSGASSTSTSWST